MMHKIKNNLGVKVLMAAVSLVSLASLAAFTLLSNVKAAAAALVLVALAVAYANITYGFMLLAFTLPFASLPQLLGNNIAYSEVVLSSLMLAYALRNFRRGEATVRPSPRNLPVLLFLLLTLAAAGKTFMSVGLPPYAGAVNSSSPYFTYRTAHMTVEFAVAYFLFANAFDRRHLKSFAHALLAGAVAASSYSVYQFLFMGAYRPSSLYGPESANMMAMYLVLVAPVAVTYHITEKKGLLRWVLPLTVGAGLILTFSRGGYIGFAASAVLMAYAERSKLKEHKRALAAAAAVLLALAAGTLALVSLEYGRAYRESALCPGPDSWERHVFTWEGPHALVIWAEDGPLHVSVLRGSNKQATVTGQSGVRTCGADCVVDAGERFDAWFNTSITLSLKGGGGGCTRAKILLEDKNAEGLVLDLYAARRLMSRLRDPYAVRYRAGLWKTGVARAFEGPFLGFGFAQFRIGEKSFEHSHNLFIQLAAERGIPCLISFLWLVSAFMRGVLGRRGYLLAFSAGVAGLLVHGLADYVFYPVSAGMLFFAYMALSEDERRVSGGRR
ncbi:MAG: hypothetical protein GF416_00105 [Candidatus Altiarchaeales archaeon]|nr:hypothetical protein [Candidatus Altiarchaeales archaeon]MBD3415523.1 hypothetical protein [Candidatus Altiarchaeales archaeon]